MPKHLNQEAWMENESGERYEEYGTKIEGNVVTCYIASEADKIFSLHWQRRDYAEQTDCDTEFWVDGILLDDNISDETDFDVVSSKGHYQDNVRSRYKPYKFANISLSDEGQAECRRDYGTISVTSYRVIVDETRLYDWEPVILPQKFFEPMNEKAKKLGGHRVSFDDVQKKEPENPDVVYRTKPYAGEVGPYVDFVFVYRRMDVLQALGLLSLPQLKGDEQLGSILPSPNSEPSRKRARPERKKKRQAEKRKRDEDKERADLLAEEAELTCRLEQIRKRKRVLTKVKEEVKQEDSDYASLQLDNGAVDLTLID